MQNDFVKICCVTNLLYALTCVGCGGDALGIDHANSP